MSNKINLPAISKATSGHLDQLAKSLQIPRDVLASDADIETVWKNLPTVLEKIAPEFRTSEMAKLCVATSVGLFDSAINYAWNAAISELRNRVERFGLNIVGQIEKKNFDKSDLYDLMDAELLSLCLRLNLIDESAYFFLGQCRDMRNNFSAAHPPMSSISPFDVVSFLDRCGRYALESSSNPIGVDFSAFMKAIKKCRFGEGQTKHWQGNLLKTHEAQRSLLIRTLHGIYCDPNEQQDSRLNALDIVSGISTQIEASSISELINGHVMYLSEGKDGQHKASQEFFSKIGLVNKLGESERHSIISRACQRLRSTHEGWNNFHNELPFAEKLYELTSQTQVPISVKPEFVEVVIMCAIGNGYGVSRAASPFYKRMIRNFSPKEVGMMLQLSNNRSSIIGWRLKVSDSCKVNFKGILTLIDKKSVPEEEAKAFDKWTGN